MMRIGAPQETQTTWGGKKRILLPLILFDGFSSPLFPRENLLTWGSSHRGQIRVKEKKKKKHAIHTNLYPVVIGVPIACHAQSITLY